MSKINALNAANEPQKPLKKGSTAINESARREFDISRDEYAFCSYVQYRQADSRQLKDGWCTDDKDDIAYFVGISRQSLRAMAMRMEAKELLEISGAKGWFRVTPKWIDTEASCKETFRKDLQEKSDSRKETFHGHVKKLSTETPSGVKKLSETNNVSKLELNKVEYLGGDTDFSENSKSVTTFTPDQIEETNILLVQQDVIELDGQAQSTYDLYKTLEEKPLIPDVPPARKIKPDPIAEIVNHLNQKAGTSFRTTSKATRSQINARMKEGFTLEDFKTVIDFKSEQWGKDAKMSEYLRPETLFRPGHFEGYLQAASKHFSGATVITRYSLQDRPQANTPDEMRQEMSRFYNANTALWAGALDFAGVRDWKKDKCVEVVTKFCAHQISQGRGNDTFKDLNGRLQKWFLNETKAKPAAPTVPGYGRRAGVNYSE